MDGLKVLDPGCRENSARRWWVEGISSLTDRAEEPLVITDGSTDGGFFFDVADVQSDMTRQFRFNFAEKLAVVNVVVNVNRVFQRRLQKKEKN